ncbi:MAG: 2-oxoglutarate ferredoxin oxidoreductase subunit alpha, partial [Bacteriovoracaceae bacterium]|nr:2-oxoglutarate ferredoxin oxidoreductase subunit alpha [Bacteriovoracaceae bacterium]
EDEIAGICSAIGASFGGALALTTSSGPGIALKGEAMGLATMYELPIVVVNVQRGGPSTGLPTKTEQSDLMQVMYGRNGECPMIVVAASRPNDCFEMAFEACRLALEHMTPVVLLTDGYIANGAEPWKIPDLDKRFNKINSRMIDPSKTSSEGFLAYKREDKTHVRNWAVPGMEGFEHRLGGLEKDVKTGNVSYDPDNHSDMCHIRAEKVKRVEDNIPLQTLEGEDSGDVLVLSWGGTYGATHMAVKELLEQGKKVSLCHLKYINPMPKNIGEILGNFKKVLVCELNLGQMRNIINAEFNIGAIGYNKVQGLPFKISELVEAVNRQLETL